MKVEFDVPGLPPKKDGATSMWGKESTELGRIQALRRAARERLGAVGPYRRNISLDLQVHLPPGKLARAGDLDNFITGVCDGLMRAAGVQREIQWPGTEWDGCQPCDTVGIEDDSQVVSISARKVPDADGKEWYRVVLNGDR